MVTVWVRKAKSLDEEIAEWERQQAKLGRDYESPWLSGLVTFSGYAAAFIGSVAVLFVVANLPTAQCGCRTHSYWPHW